MSGDARAWIELISADSSVFTGSPDDERSDDEDEEVDAKKS